MAVYQYRISSNGNWQSQYGHGLLIINNKSDSGKKIILKTLECNVNSVQGAAIITNTSTARLMLSSASIATGESLSSSCTPFNSSGSSLLNITVTKNESYIGNSGSNDTLAQYSIIRAGAAAGTQNRLNTHRNIGSIKLSGLYFKPSSSLVEGYTVPPGYSISLVPTYIGTNSPMYVNVTFNVNSSTYNCKHFVNTYPGQSLFTITNPSGSNITCSISSIAINEAGTTDTPYLRVVPVGQLGTEFLNDSFRKNISIMPMDSTYPTASEWINIYSDLYFIPYGVPESYLTETTAGIPKGFNYLQTKDFNGPTFRTIFPEYEHIKPNGAKVSSLGHTYGFKNADLGFINGGLTINQGESIAIVASSETAAVGQPSWSGWPVLNFAAQISVENAYIPYLTLTGIKDNSEVRIYNAGTTDELTGAENVTGGSFSWQYDYSIYSSVDIVVHALGYVYYRIESISLPNSGLTIPIDQQIDRTYSNA